jgi:hypothetical protein
LLHERTKVPVAVYIREGIDLVLRQYGHLLPGQLSLAAEQTPAPPAAAPVAAHTPAPADAKPLRQERPERVAGPAAVVEPIPERAAGSKG